MATIDMTKVGRLEITPLSEKRPNIDDLRWEILRRNDEFRTDYQRFKNGWEAKGNHKKPKYYSSSKWKIMNSADPSIPWHELPFSPCFDHSDAPVSMVENFKDHKLEKESDSRT